MRLPPPGTVSPFGLLNNPEGRDIQVYFDKGHCIRGYHDFHPNEKTIFVATQDLFKFLSHLGYDYQILELWFMEKLGLLALQYFLDCNVRKIIILLKSKKERNRKAWVKFRLSWIDWIEFLVGCLSAGLCCCMLVLACRTAISGSSCMARICFSAGSLMFRSQ